MTVGLTSPLADIQQPVGVSCRAISLACSVVNGICPHVVLDLVTLARNGFHSLKDLAKAARVSYADDACPATVVNLCHFRVVAGPAPDCIAGDGTVQLAIH